MEGLFKKESESLKRKPVRFFKNLTKGATLFLLNIFIASFTI